MKYLTTLFFCLTLAVCALAVDVEPIASPEGQSFYGIPMPSGQLLTPDDILQYKPRQLAKKHGVKLKFKQRVALSVVRGKLKRAQRKGADINTAFDEAGASGSSFHLGGFILGFFLGLLGWLLAILIWPNMGAGRSALLGFAIWLIVVILFVV